MNGQENKEEFLATLEHFEKSIERDIGTDEDRLGMLNASSSGIIKFCFSKKLLQNKLGKKFYNDLKSNNCYSDMYIEWQKIHNGHKTTIPKTNAEFGLAMEEYLLYRLRLEYPDMIIQKAKRVVDKFSNIAATCDAICQIKQPIEFDGEYYHGNGVVELKTVRLNRRRANDVDLHRKGIITIPSKHFLQMQCQMLALRKYNVDYGVMVALQMVDEYQTEDEDYLRCFYARTLSDVIRYDSMDIFHKMYGDKFIVNIEFRKANENIRRLLKATAWKIKKLKTMKQPPKPTSFENYSNRDVINYLQCYNLVNGNYDQFLSNVNGDDLTAEQLAKLDDLINCVGMVEDTKKDANVLEKEVVRILMDAGITKIKTNKRTIILNPTQSKMTIKII